MIMKTQKRMDLIISLYFKAIKEILKETKKRLGNRRSIQLSYGGPWASCEMLPVLGSLLASVDAHQIASGVAGVNAAVGKDGDGPAAALQD